MAPVRRSLGWLPSASHGADVDSLGNGTIAAPRLYQLVRQVPTVVDRLFTIEFLEPGAEAFAFTFGWMAKGWRSFTSSANAGE